MDIVFEWIGMGVVALLAFCLVAFILLWLYVNCIHDRFSAIWFRKGQRRLSIASWHRTRVKKITGDDQCDENWPADDWPINERPLYLSFRVGHRRLFLLAGLLEGPRHRAIKGCHP